MYNFEFVKPTTVADAVAALAEEDAQALGGGQTLIPTLKQRLAAPSKLVSLAGIAEMKGISQEGDVLVIGGGTTHGAVAEGAGGSGAGSRNGRRTLAEAPRPQPPASQNLFRGFPTP